MADPEIVDVVRQYLAILPEFGIHPERAVLFGSWLRGDANEWSDIDLVVIAPEFDRECDISTVQRLWRARLKSDDRIEPIACGVREWMNVSATKRPILDIALTEGEIIEAAPVF
jgi:predicted nucleotidyltransferase